MKCTLFDLSKFHILNYLKLYTYLDNLVVLVLLQWYITLD